MYINILKDIKSAGSAAAHLVSNRLISVINDKGHASLILATGASQFTFLDALIKYFDQKKSNTRFIHVGPQAIKIFKALHF